MLSVRAASMCLKQACSRTIQNVRRECLCAGASPSMRERRVNGVHHALYPGTLASSYATFLGLAPQVLGLRLRRRLRKILKSAEKRIPDPVVLGVRSSNARESSALYS